MVTIGAGSGTDIQARLYAKFLPKYLPGQPTIIVRNMPGGANTIAPNFVYGSKPDGLNTLCVGVSSALNQLVGMKIVQYDVLKMPVVIGAPSSGVFFTKPGIIDKPEDFPQAKGLIVGTSSGATSYFFITAKEVLNLPLTKAAWYPGSGEAFRAFLSGEINLGWAANLTYNESVAESVAKKEIMPLFQLGFFDEKGNSAKDPGIQGSQQIPTVQELYVKVFGNQPSGMAWEVYKTVLSSFDRIVFLPPGTPDGIVRAYWRASEEMLKDPEYLKISDQLVGVGARWWVGEASDKQFKANFSMKPEVREWLKVTLPKYNMVVE